VPDLERDLRMYVDRLAADAEEYACQRVAAPRRRAPRLLGAAAAVFAVLVLAVTVVAVRGDGERPAIRATTAFPQQATPDQLRSREDSNIEVFVGDDASWTQVGGIDRTIRESGSISRYGVTGPPLSFLIELADCSAQAELQTSLAQLPGVGRVQPIGGC
jgi:hypothetical protein